MQFLWEIPFNASPAKNGSSRMFSGVNRVVAASRRFSIAV